MVPVKLPKEVLKLFPTWEHRCLGCGTYVESNTSFCPNCKTPFDEKRWRVPPRFLKSHDAMSEYAHKVLAPKLTSEQRILLFKYFTELFSDGFESGDFSAWTGTSEGAGESVEVQDTTKHHGSYAMKATGTDEAYAYKTFAAQTTAFTRFYVRWTSLDATSGTRPIRILGSGSLITTVLIESDRIGLYVIGEFAYEDATFNVDQWYCIEVKFVKHASDGEFIVYVDGAPTVTRTGQDTSGFNDADTIRVGIADYGAHSTTAYVDCVLVADTYIGPESTGQTYTKAWTTDALFKKLGIAKVLSLDAAFQRQDIPETFGIDAEFLKRDITISKQIDVLIKKLDLTKNFGLSVTFAYKVRLPELWLDENGKIVLNISKPYTWVGT